MADPTPLVEMRHISKHFGGLQALTDAVHIDRLNVGPIPTSRLNWLQPHEGNLIDFLFRSRAYQVPEQKITALA